MTNWIYLVGTNCSDPSQEREFNEWYDTIHIPDLLKRVPGLMRATRYEVKKVIPAGRTSPGMPKFVAGPTAEDVPKYLAIYEIESDDIEKEITTIRDESRKLGELGRMSPLVVIVSRYLYRQISTPREKVPS